jgi:uncharacterized protein YjlB
MTGSKAIEENNRLRGIARSYGEFDYAKQQRRAWFRKEQGNLCGSEPGGLQSVLAERKLPMPVLESVKKAVEKVTGIGRPPEGELSALLRVRKAQTFQLHDDGETPNNERLPLVLFRSPVRLDRAFDPAAVFEDLFDANGWRGSWRDDMYEFNHWHTVTHEVLGIARGWLQAEFGGVRGHKIHVKASDVLILPAGTGHRRLRRSDDLLVVGAYPAGSDYDEKRPRDHAHDESVVHIARVPEPICDPVYGPRGPLVAAWRKATQKRPRRRR